MEAPDPDDRGNANPPDPNHHPGQVGAPHPGPVHAPPGSVLAGLPADVVQLVLDRLEPEDLVRLRQVSTANRNLGTQALHRGGLQATDTMGYLRLVHSEIAKAELPQLTAACDRARQLFHQTKEELQHNPSPDLVRQLQRRVRELQRLIGAFKSKIHSIQVTRDKLGL